MKDKWRMNGLVFPCETWEQSDDSSGCRSRVNIDLLTGWIVLSRDLVCENSVNLWCWHHLGGLALFIYIHWKLIDPPHWKQAFWLQGDFGRITLFFQNLYGIQKMELTRLNTIYLQLHAPWMFMNLSCLDILHFLTRDGHLSISGDLPLFWE